MNPEQLTAWALNELSDEERAQIEALIAASPDDTAKAQELKGFCQFLGEHLVNDDAALDAERRAALEQLAVEITGTTGGREDSSNVTEFDPAVVPAKMNGKTVRAKVLEQREQRRGPGVLVWIAGLAACLVFTMFVILPSVRQRSGDLVAVAKEKAPFVTLNASFEKAEGSELVRIAPPVKQEAKVDSLMLAQAPPSPLPTLKDAKPSSALPAPSDLPITLSSPTARRATAVADKSLEVLHVTTGSSSNGMLPVAGRDETKMQDGSRPVAMNFIPTPTLSGEARFEFHEEGQNSVHTDGYIGTERYGRIVENKFLEPAHDPLSTFSIDVDSASYANVRRFLNEGRLPPPDAVRLEELVNYFPYDYEAPAKDSAQPFSVQVDVAEAPWEATHRLARIGIKGREVGMERQQANFVFLVDVSGSMGEPNKMPLLKRSLLMLTEQIKDDDRVSIVTYAGECGLALESTSGKDRKKIVGVVNSLHTSGSTNGASGIEMAYEQAQKNFISEGINRVILCTDGDFNVGVSSPEALEKLIKEKAKGGVFLSVLGFGTGNLKDQQMETLADKGNGNYAYIDSLSEARKVLVEQMTGTLITIAKDVKIQVEFNPTQVRSYRLIGYENRLMAKEDFNNDRKDAGEIGAGHTVTALYEIVPMDAPLPNIGPLVDDLKYQPKPEKALPQMTGVPTQKKLEGINDEMLTVKLRYKEPDGQVSKLIEVPLRDGKKTLKESPRDFQFAAAVAGFGLKLRDSEHVGELSWEAVRKLALNGKGEDKLGYRGEFIQLVDKANGMK